MTVDEADKINDLYKQLDALTAENNVLKESLSDRFDTLEALVKDLACKCTNQKAELAK